MAFRHHERQLRGAQLALQRRGAFLQPQAFLLAGLEVAHSLQRTGGQRRRQRRGENEGRGIGADEVDDIAVGRDIAAHAAKGLGQRAFDDVDPVCLLIAFGYPATVQAVEPDRVDFVEVGQRAVLFREVADGADWGEIAFHRVTGLKGDDLGAIGVGLTQLGFKIGHVVVLKDHLLSARPAHRLDHRRVVQPVGENQAILEVCGQRAQRSEIADVAGGKDQPGFLAVQLRQLPFQFHVQLVGAGNIARATDACTLLQRGVGHGLLYADVLTHAQIVVRAPDGNLPRLPGQRITVDRLGVLTRHTLKVGKDAVAPFLVQR